MSRKKCCVPGCMESGRSHGTMHMFPNPEKHKNRFNQWIYSIGGDIIGLENEDIYKHRSVCHAHFEEKYCCRNNKLSNIAVPTLNLPDPSSLHKFTNENIQPKLTNENIQPKLANENIQPKLTNENIQPKRTNKNNRAKVTNEMNKSSTRVRNIDLAEMSSDDTTDEDDASLMPNLTDDDSDKTDASSGTECLLSPERPESMRSPRVETEWLDTEEVFIPTETEWLLSPTEAESMLNPIETESMLTPVENKSILTPVERKSLLTPMKTKSVLTSVETKSVPTHLKTALRLTPVGMKSVPPHLKTALRLMPVGTKSVPTHLKTALKLMPVGTKSVPTHLKTALKLIPVETKSVPTHLKTAALVLTDDGPKSVLTDDGPKSMLTPVVTKSMLTPVVNKSMLTPVVTKSMLTPVVTKPVLTPMKTASKHTTTESESLLISKVCRMCLGTDKTLQELNESLSDYFLEICNCMNAPSKLLSCDSCAESLENNLDFRNKCRKANQMFEEWKKDIKMNKRPSESLQLIEDDNRKIEDIDKTELRTRKNLFVNDNGDIVIFNVETETLDINNKTTNGAIQQEINTFPFGVDHEIVVKTYENNNVGKRVRKDTLIENRNNKKTKTRPMDNIDNVRKQLAMYMQRGQLRRKFSQYESVFDIQVFHTYADARRELESRRQSEPYLSAQYRCEVCYRVYKNNGQLQFHMKWHDSSPELCYECDVCEMRFSRHCTLLTHKPKCHRAKFSCKLCPLVIYERQLMKMHFAKHQGKTYTCHCKRVFKHLGSLVSHKRAKHSNSHVCVTCARTYASELGLQHHRLRVHQTECDVDSVSPSSVHCAPCGLTFPSRQVYTVHLLKTEEHKDAAAKIIACSLCGEEFDEAVQVKAHKKRDHKRFQYKTYKRPLETKHISEDYQCKLCGAVGAGRRWLYGHYQREHPGEPYEVPHAQRDHLCDQCGKGFYTKAKLEEHELIHSGLKPFSCNICSKVFRTKKSLKDHVERHMPATRECPHCGKMFRGAANLHSHIRCHTNDRRFVCTYCGKGFLHRAAMREHVRGVHLHIRRQKKKS